ncbi:hypothetical protein [Aeromicrobium sp.]|uniref:hypothetical protein n=1 Tax=Aeromicrobium sp. TaxID=1871063 RepID=UPI002FC9C4E3
MELIRVGYWLGSTEPGWPDPRNFVDLSWNGDERAEVVLHLRQGAVAKRYMGLSECRFCGELVGSLELSDGTYVWPEGLTHYVDQHGVRLPQSFVDHMSRARDSLEDAVVDDSWWRSIKSWK